MSDKSSKQHPKLVMLTGGGEGTEFPLDRDVTKIGRAIENEIILNDKSASRVHSEINNLDGECYIRDLNSRNGTEVNGVVVSETRLNNGDIIRIGKTSFKFIDPLADKEDVSGGEATFDFDEEDWESLALGKEGEKKREKKKAKEPLLSIRNIIIGIAIVVVILIVAAFYVIFSGEEEFVNVPMPLPQDPPYGYMAKGDQNHFDKVIYEFEVNFDEPVELLFKVYDIDDDQEVVIKLNGETIHAVEPTGDGVYSALRRLKLPDDLVYRDRTNRVIFINNRYPPIKDYWAVSNVNIEPAKVYVCQEEKGRATYEVAKSKYDTRKIMLGNLWECIKLLEETLRLSEVCVPKPDYYLEAVNLLATSKEELDERYRKLLFTVERDKRMRRYADVKMNLIKITRLIPDPTDERHVKAQKDLRRINRLTKKK